MRTWVYEIYPDGKAVEYVYRGVSRKYDTKKEISCTTKKVIAFYSEVKKAVFSYPYNIISCLVCDGCSYRLQISYTDGRKEIVEGDIGGGIVDKPLVKFINKLFGKIFQDKR